MPVTDIIKDVENRTLTITAAFAAPVERVWALYEDPRQLEQVWGPPEFPATFVHHELQPGTRSTYYMTSPTGDRFAGFWDITGVDAPQRFTFDDGFALEDFTPNPELPLSQNVYAFASVDGGTNAQFTSTYATVEALQQVLDMGMEDGARSSINQIDEFLARG
jgi:uncharacterized protein YndB with AHSA1/START domain